MLDALGGAKPADGTAEETAEEALWAWAPGMHVRGPAGSAWQPLELRVQDAPRFKWRGLMLDTARHYMPPEAIEQLLSLMAANKLNVLHMHLVDRALHALWWHSSVAICFCCLLALDSCAASMYSMSRVSNMRVSESHSVIRLSRYVMSRPSLPCLVTLRYVTLRYVAMRYVVRLC